MRVAGDSEPLAPDVPATPQPPLGRPVARSVLSPDWLPVALLIGDSVIAGFAVLAAYWYRYNLDRLNPTNGQQLDFGPYLAAVLTYFIIYPLDFAALLSPLEPVAKAMATVLSVSQAVSPWLYGLLAVLAICWTLARVWGRRPA